MREPTTHDLARTTATGLPEHSIARVSRYRATWFEADRGPHLRSCVLVRIWWDRSSTRSVVPIYIRSSDTAYLAWPCRWVSSVVGSSCRSADLRATHSVARESLRFRRGGRDVARY